MLRIDLGADGVARTRFAISPLRVANDLLYIFGDRPYLLSSRWRARTRRVLESRGLELLAAVASPSTHLQGYAADFISPQPAAYDNDLDEELHQVAITRSERLGYEMQIAFAGHAMEPATPDSAPPVVLRHAVQFGEHHLAELVAAQLEQFWKLALKPHWSRIRQSMEDDITARAAITARNGFDHMISGLTPGLAWRDGGLDIDHPVSVAGGVTATAMILTPSVFAAGFMYSIDPADAPTPRLPTLSYRAIRPQTRPVPSLDELIGTTRARLLAALTTPHTTTELAEHLHLSRSTISYHLQILHRSGLLHRTHHNRTIHYQTIPPTLQAAATGQPYGRPGGNPDLPRTWA